ncbi:hypothetical protein K466DRAFT_145245 [Polyporus arcularius HHB13444]|uniref:Uncharacterized protein n=1 Tax=Polyporus arcularius HHB13444 TaxID=1314778 RepID=A0A5C3PZC0_9APHY|nr:hypothetical protein K466DRAFT_145245 [Polyporus arcularius HHB13444]
MLARPSMTEETNPESLSERLLHALQQYYARLDLDDLKHIEGTVAVILAITRRGINSYTSINALPAEVLGMIFHRCLPSEGTDIRVSGYKEPRVTEQLHSRIVLTHVCRRWRDLALEMRSFWTVIDESSRDCSSAFLARSEGMPLQVYIKLTSSRHAGQMLVPYGEGIRDLHVRIHSSTSSTAPQFPFDASNLERLCIVTNHPPRIYSRPDIDIDMSPVLFPGPTHRLKMLILRDMCWLPVLPHTNLTHLHFAQGGMISLVALLAFLGRCTALEELILVDIHIRVRSVVPLNHMVSLPHLRMLVLRMNRLQISMQYLLQQLSLPSAVTLRINGTDTFRALSGLSPFPKLSFTSGIDTLSIDEGFGSFVVRASGPSCALLLDFPDYYMEATYHDAMRLMASLIPFDSIVDLRYRSHILHARLAMHLLAGAHMPSLRKLYFVDTPAVLRSGAVVAEADHDAYVDAICWALSRSPNLQELQLWSADPEFPSRLELPFSAPSVRTLVFHRSGRSDAVFNLDTLRDQAPDARMCSCLECEPPMAIPGADPVHHIYEWLS